MSATLSKTPLLLLWQLGSRIGGTKSNSVRVAIFGIVLGTAMLSATLTILRGYENTLREELFALGSHVEVYARQGLISNWEEIADTLRAQEHVASVRPSFNYAAAIREQNNLRPLHLHAVDYSADQYAVTKSAPSLMARDIVLGVGLAADMNLVIGDYVDLLIMPPNYVSNSKPLRRRLKLAGLHDSGTHMDRTLGIISYQTAANMADADIGQTATLDIVLRDPADARKFHAATQQQLYAQGLWMLTWEDRHSALFATIELSRRILMVLLLSLMIIAAFNVAGTLLIVLEQRRYELARLLMMGLGHKMLIATMVIRGLYLGLYGGILGVCAGVALAFLVDESLQFLNQCCGLQLLSTEVYFLDRLPASLSAGDALIALSSALVVCAIATTYPAFRVARLKPVHAMADRALL